jgi:NTP pyrophosphatase (non-canonical NTP hydrolase)
VEIYPTEHIILTYLFKKLKKVISIMIDLKSLQKDVYKNKVDKGFNVTDVYFEFCHTFIELTEACEAYSKKKGDLGEELADVAIYLLGISEILDIDLEKEILEKIEKNKKRQYVIEDGIPIRIGD